ncbi:hypothetical protein [Dysgonomonas sp. 520]|uniref:Cbp1 family collagen-binding glycoprotein adhesin n=1 Tax=Dysgonomonas sp. 520 TaxID=2302931 RepID=UPI0013D466A8|nr:hypothetical protein [Dysgonomonas sp. 520]NDW10301.1 hypothetical protein [Dysgonomonas sp. 520]
MKKLILGFTCVALLASCNLKNSDQENKLKAENDSLRTALSQGEQETAEMAALISEVQENFNQIREAEKYLAVQSTTKGEMSADTKTEIQNNFAMINDILKKNRETIATLNQKMSKGGKEATAFKSTIEQLTAELEKRAATITELQEALATRDATIAKLANDNKDLTVSNQDLTDKNVAQAAKIKEQDKALNTAYYMFGTSKELKEAKVVSGGFLVSSKLMKESIDKNKFIKIDIRNTKEIPVYAKKAKILSDHPSTSYNLVKDANGNVVVMIIDHQKFWSLTPYLVIEVS